MTSNSEARARGEAPLLRQIGNLWKQETLLMT